MSRDIEQLLALGAGHAGPVDLADVRRRAVRQRRVRAAVTTAGCAAAAVALVAGAAGLAGGTDRAQVVATTPPAVTTPPPDPTPSPSPEPSESPTPSATPSPSSTPSPPPAARPVSVARSAGAAPGLRVTITLTSPDLRAGAAATLRIEAVDGNGGTPYARLLDWADGGAVHRESHEFAMCEGPYPAPTPPARWSADFPHAWRQPGRYVVVVTVGSDQPCESGVAAEAETFRLAVDVAPGDSSGNGPVAVTATIEPEWSAHAEGEMFLRLDLHDPDGYFPTATVDWGDGTAPSVPRSALPCNDGDGRHYPADDMFETYVEHTYADPSRSYTITVTTASTACDGTDRQPFRDTVVLRGQPPTSP